MDLLPIVCGTIVLVGTGIMLAAVIRVREVLGIVELATEPHRSWLSHRIRFHRGLMVFFTLGYVAFAASLLSGQDVISVTAVAAVFFCGSLFVYVGIAIQSRMSAAMMRTLQGFVPVCAWCKKVKTKASEASEEDTWESLESYLVKKSEVNLTHGICDTCENQLDPD